MRTSTILIVVGLAAPLTTGIYEAHRVTRLSAQVQVLEQGQAGFPEKMLQLRQECGRAVEQNAALREENQRLNDGPATEVLKLRGELARLWADSQELRRLKALEREPEKGDDWLTPKVWLARVDTLKTWIAAHPDQQIPEFQWLQIEGWLDIVKNTNLLGPYAPRHAAQMLRRGAKEAFGEKMSVALRTFVNEHDGELPGDLRQLNPYLSAPIPDNLLNTYKLLYSGKDADVPKGKWPIVEIRPLEEPGDTHLVIGTKMSTFTRE